MATDEEKNGAKANDDAATDDDMEDETGDKVDDGTETDEDDDEKAKSPKSDDGTETDDEKRSGSYAIKGQNGSGIIHYKEDGSTPITNWKGDPTELFAKAGFPYQHELKSDTFLMHYGMKMTPGGAPAFPMREMEVGTKSFKGKGAGDAAKDFRPNEEEYGKILQLMGKAYPQDMIKVYYTVSCDSQTDRHGEHFNKKSGTKIAKMGYDQPVMKDHNYYSSDGVFAKMFDGAVSKSGDGGFDVNHKIYMIDLPDAETQKIIHGIESGVNNKLSIGIRLRRKDYLCDICNKAMFYIDHNYNYEWCGHWVGMELKDGTIVTATISDITDMMELSRVTVPAQKFAAIKPDTAPKTNADLKIGVLGKSERGILAASEARNSKAAIISTEVSKGDTDVTEEEKAKKAADAATAEAAKVAADKAAADKAVADKAALDAEAAAKAAATAEAATVNEKFAEATKVFNESIAKANEVIATLGATSEKLNKALETQTEKTTTLEKNVAEGREFLSKIAAAHLDLAQKVGVVVSKSNEDIARMVSNSKHMPHRKDAEMKAKAGSDDFYDTVADKFEKSAQQ